MTVRTFLIGSIIAATLAWTIWILILNFLDPTQAGLLGFFLFFLALFLAVSSTGSLIGYTVRRLIAPRQLAAYAVRAAIRQGALLGIFLDILLLLLHLRLYQWWIVVILICLFLVIEFIFLGYDRAARRPTQQTQS